MLPYVGYLSHDILHCVYENSNTQNTMEQRQVTLFASSPINSLSIFGYQLCWDSGWKVGTYWDRVAKGIENIFKIA